ncbi:Dienelactone hydrolase [Algoriphagus locisalis]|uniref:Dienelactone hydrolase n=1 Tax=Algoriphagus locisalis TaxID=305507 RepID=A0A1I7DR18_9BACT|nr:prolyl oligopeptidase family serine peptidase [Algoriphagus locisalis]SFU14074.1 Dienelactone hydrolase [Algoriphagus locisalis]
MKIQILTFLLLFQTSLLIAQTSLEQLNLENGKFEVGFRNYTTADSTRNYSRIYDYTNQKVPRPISVSVWYPASLRGNEKQISVLDYMETLKEEEEWENLPNDQILNWFYYQNTAANQNHLKETTAAFANAEFEGGKFPVIIYAPSYQAPSIENFALCEYLASHGYLVISSPSRGTENRWLEGGTEKDMETQARDIEFLTQELNKVPSADLDQIATMGFSFGGLSNVLSQIRNDNIKAIVSLDGSIKYQYETLKKSTFFDLNKVDVPFIHFSQKDIPKEVLEADKIDAALNTNFEFYDSLSFSDAYQLKFHNLTHSQFSTLGVLFEQRDPRQDKSDPEIMESYKWLAVYTLNFLDGYLKDDSNGLEFIQKQPSENGIKKELISLKYKEKEVEAFSFQDFNDLARKQNYEDLLGFYESIKSEYPSLSLPEGDLNTLGLQLLFNPKTSQKGINILLFATNLYPTSANLFDSLAEAYLFVGNQEMAVKNFRKSLELYPQNQNAINRLNQLNQ